MHPRRLLTAWPRHISARSRGTPVSEHHDRNAALMPWGVPSMASSRISLGNDSLVSARPVVGLGKASPSPLPTLRASASTSSERADSGTRWAVFVLVRSGGIVHTAPSMSNSDHSAPRTSPERAAVRVRNSRPNLAAALAFDARIFSRAAATSL